jgi:hypothetical protein
MASLHMRAGDAGSKANTVQYAINILCSEHVDDVLARVALPRSPLVETRLFSGLAGCKLPKTRSSRYTYVDVQLPIRNNSLVIRASTNECLHRINDNFVTTNGLLEALLKHVVLAKLIILELLRAAFEVAQRRLAEILLPVTRNLTLFKSSIIGLKVRVERDSRADDLADLCLKGSNVRLVVGLDALAGIEAHGLGFALGRGGLVHGIGEIIEGFALPAAVLVVLEKHADDAVLDVAGTVADLAGVIVLDGDRVLEGLLVELLLSLVLVLCDVFLDLGYTGLNIARQQSCQ